MKPTEFTYDHPDRDVAAFKRAIANKLIYAVGKDPVAARADARFAPIDAQPDALRSPDGLERSLRASMVLRWEFGPGSFLTVVATQQREGAPEDLERSPASALSGLLADRPHTALLVKLSRRFGS